MSTERPLLTLEELMMTLTTKKIWTDLEIISNDGIKLHYCRYGLWVMSPVFKTMLLGDFQEGKSDSISLPFSGKTITFALFYINDNIQFLAQGFLATKMVCIDRYLEVLPEMLSFLDMYQMDGMKMEMDKSICSYMKKQDSIPIDFINLIFQYDYPKAQAYICSQIEEIRNDHEHDFSHLDVEVIKSLSVDYFYYYIDDWLSEENLKYLDDILTHIRDSTKKDYLSDSLIPLLKKCKDKQLVEELLWKYAEHK